MIRNINKFLLQIVAPVATNTVTSDEFGNDGIVTTTNTTYHLSFVTQIFRNG
jgi:hypothetical protein